MHNSFFLYRRLLKYLRPYRKRFVLGLLSMALAASMEPALPILLKPLLDGEFNQVDGGYPWIVGVGLVLMVMFRGVAGYSADYFMNWLSNQIVVDLRRQMFDHILHLSVPQMDIQHSSFLINKVMNDVNNLMGACTTVLTSIVRDSITLLGLMCWLFWLNWSLTLVFLLVVPVAAFTIRKFSILMRRFSLRSLELNGNLLQILQEIVESYRTIKIFSGKPYESKRFSEALKVWKKQQMRISNAQGAVMPITQVIASVALAIVIVVATHQTTQQILTVGAMVSYLTAALMLMPAMRRISSVSATIQRGLASAESVFNLIDMALEQTPQESLPHQASSSAQTKISPEHLSGAISFKSISFTYPGRDEPALHHFNLTINPGESIALVGASGAGKSTITSLLCGFYHDYQGQIIFDTYELSQLDLLALRRQVSVVTQEIRLFNDTVRANIAYGELADCHESDIIKAAEAAQAMEFIHALPQGLQTHVGERGLRLSGGQRQRIAIARALLKNAPILILDEATSALDSESEYAVQQAINVLMQNRTTVIVAHRLSTIRSVSRIVVLQNGSIIEEGSHESLWRQQGYYVRYCAMQNKHTNTTEKC